MVTDFNFLMAFKNPPRRLNFLSTSGRVVFGAPGERTFYRVKVPNPPGSGKG